MWHNFQINENQIEAETNSAYLIKTPKSYGDYYFWHPAKLLRKKGWFYSVGITNDFSVTLKSKKGTVIKTITGVDLLEIFSSQSETLNSNLENAKPKVDKNIPEVKEVREKKIIDDLID